MSLIKPTITEELFRKFYKLESDRPRYYLAVYSFARAIFINLNDIDRLNQMDLMIREKLEKPMGSDFQSICDAFDDYRHINNRYAYVKVGDEIDFHYVTRYDIGRVLEDIKQWIYDEITELAQYVRFTRPSEIYG